MVAEAVGGRHIAGLLETLLDSLKLEFVVMRLNRSGDGLAVEMMRVAESTAPLPSEWSLASARLGLDGGMGILVAGALRLDFPTDADMLRLELAASRCALALHQSEVAPEVDPRCLVNSMPGLIAVLTPAGDVDVVNNELVEFCGQPIEAMKQWATNGIVHPRDVPKIAPVFTQSIASGRAYDFEARIRRHDGVYRWFQVRGIPLRDAGGTITCWEVFLSDIDNLKRTEQELRRLVETIPAFVWRGTAEGELDYLNDRAEGYLGHSAESLANGRWLELIHPDQRDAVVRRWLHSVTTSESYDDSYQILRADGRYRWIRSVGEPLRSSDGRIAHWYGLVVDIEDRKQTEEALSKAGAELAYVSRVTTLSALTASIAHEVNQPLAGIMTNASTCLRMLDAAPPDIDGARETVRRTIRDGNRASDVIERLRALFRRREFTPEPLDLNDAARDVIALTSNDLQRNRITLQSELAGDLPLVVGDRIQLQQVILNLLRNASDAMCDVHDRPRQVVITTEREVGRVRLTVRDAGVGFSTPNTDTLFDAFYTTKTSGMGIGLFVSRSIIERHDGRLWAEPNDGPGVSFSFFIPSV